MPGGRYEDKHADGRRRRGTCRPNATVVAAAALASAAAVVFRANVAGAQIWDGGGGDDNWTTAGNWDNDLVPANDGSASVTFAGSVRTSPNLNTDFSLALFAFEDSSAAFTLDTTSASALTTAAISAGDSASGALINCSLRLGAANVPIHVEPGGAASGIDLEIAARIGQSAGTCGFTKTGDGTLKLSPQQANTYTGPVHVNGGTLLLASTDQSDDGSIRGNLIVGDGIGAALADVVRDLRDGQIVETAGYAVTVNSSGLLDINGYNEAVFDLNVNGGRADAGGGVLEVQGTATVSAGGSLRSGAGGQLLMDNDLHVSDGGSMLSIAAGGLSRVLGATHLTAGSVQIASAATLEPWGDVFAHASSSSSTISGAGVLSLSFFNVLDVEDGPAAVDLDITAPLGGIVFGADFIKQGSGALRLAGSGGTVSSLQLRAGTLLLASNSAITGAAVTLVGGVLAPSSASRSLPNAISITGDATFDTPSSLDLTLSGAITGTGSITKTGAGLLALATDVTQPSALSVNGGTIQLTPAQTRVLRAGSVAISAGARIDLRDNKLITATAVGTWDGLAYSDVTGMIASGRNGGGGGAWSGSGIVTSQSDATTGTVTSIGVATAAEVKGVTASDTAVWAGQTVTGSDTLVMYTYGGDANLDGKINVDDYGRIDFNVNLGTAGWVNGDFNYDGKVNVDDYGIIDFNIGIQGAAFPTSAQPLGGLAAVPEPGGAGSLLLAVGGFMWVQRREGHRQRRQRRRSLPLPRPA